MNLRIVGPILGVAALGVGYQNWSFFQERRLTPAALFEDVLDEYSDEDDESYALGMSSVLTTDIDRYLAELGPTDRNPFEISAPLQVSSDSRSHDRQLVLDGTLVGETRRVAWIDGVSVSEGSTVGEYWIAEIGPAWIFLESPGSPPFRIEVGEAANAAGTLAENTPQGTAPTNDVVEGFDE